MSLWRIMPSMPVCSKFRRVMSIMVSRRIAIPNWGEGTVTTTKVRHHSVQPDTFVSRLRVTVRGGHGGSGCTNFRTSGHSALRFADGGDGGDGGNVILECSAALWDFSTLPNMVYGYGGGQGHSKKRVGSQGPDKIVQVPIGTVIHVEKGIIPSVESSTVLPDTAACIDGGESKSKKEKFSASTSVRQLQGDCRPSSESTHTEVAGISSQGNPRLKTMATDAGNAEDNKTTVLDTTNRLLSDCSTGHRSVSDDEFDDEYMFEVEDNLKQASLQSSTKLNRIELVSPGECLLVASGGKGGKGNAYKARTCGRKEDNSNVEHEPGHPGSEAILILELKVIIDVGLVGLQDSGTSLLLSVMSRAKTKDSHHSLTIPNPSIGRVLFGDYFALTVVDVLSLLECEHEHDEISIAFLKGLEHTKTLAYVLDLASCLGEQGGLSPWDQLELLKSKLEKCQAGLSHRPSVIVANRVDQAGAHEVLTELRRRLPSAEIFSMPAAMEEGISSLKWVLRFLADDADMDTPSL